MHLIFRHDPSKETCNNEETTAEQYINFDAIHATPNTMLLERAAELGYKGTAPLKCFKAKH